jgi:outer membrane protein OmpA-like peptidoglycan-associated protein
MRAKPAVPPGAMASASPSPTPVARAAIPLRPVASRTPAIALARPETVAEFLNSNDPAPRHFSLDTIVFAPGSAVLDSAAAKAVDGIAGVMTTHLNTQFKLAAATDGGALALRRAAAIRAALIARGVASYRIATGRARTRSHATTSGVEMIILAK